MAITAVTEGTLNGKGIFDVLMRASKAHLDDEFAKNRFSGEDYATLYLGVMNGVLQQAIQYALSESQSAAQAELLVAQTSKTQREEALVAQQITNLTTEGQNLIKQGLILDKEVLLTQGNVDKVKADTLLAERQEANLQLEGNNIPLIGIKMQADINTATYQQEKLQEETLLVEQQRLNQVAEGVNIPKQGNLIDAQVAKTNADTDVAVANEQVATNTALRTAEEVAQITAAISKINKEVEVLEQRRKSEVAQIDDTVDGVAVTGVLGKQKGLYEAQTNGFARDAEQKLAKLMTDVWAVQRTTDEGFSVSGTGMDNASIQDVISKARQGIGLTS